MRLIGALMRLKSALLRFISALANNTLLNNLAIMSTFFPFFPALVRLISALPLLEQTRRHGAGNAPKSAGEDPPSGASFIKHFRRREIGAQSAPEISDFPAPSCGLSGAGDYLFVRANHFPVPSWGLSGAGDYLY